MTVGMTGGTAFDFHFDEALRERGVTGAYSLLLGADQSMTPPGGDSRLRRWRHGRPSASGPSAT